MGNIKEAGKSILRENGQKAAKKIQKPLPVDIMVAILLFVIITRFLLTLLPSYKVDMGGYRAWSLYMANNGFKDLYDQFHIVYAPAYMFLLWVSGEISTLFSLNAGTHEILIKMWAVISDILGGYLIFLIGKKYGKQRTGLLAGVIYSLNPAVFFNSSIWGQFDSIPATMLLAVIYCFNLRKSITAAILFGAAMLTKPQSVVLAPIVLILYFKSLSVRKIILTLTGGICTYIFITVPFASGRSLFWIVKLYLTSGGDYPYATANGFNLWTLFGAQTVFDSEPFMGLTYAIWSLILLGGAAAVSVWIIMKNRNSALTVYYVSYFICFAAFMFGSRMHERYLFPALIFVMVCIIWDRKLWITAAVLSICHFVNQWYVYKMSFKDIYWVSPRDTAAYIVAAITMGVMCYTIYYLFRLPHLLLQRKTLNYPQRDNALKRS